MVLSRRDNQARSICLASYGPKWPRKHGPGFTLGNLHPPELALKGPPGTARIGSEPSNRTASAFLAPSGRNVYLALPRVNPGLKFSCPFGAGPSGCMTDAKQILVPGYYRADASAFRPCYPPVGIRRGPIFSWFIFIVLLVGSASGIRPKSRCNSSLLAKLANVPGGVSYQPGSS